MLSAIILLGCPTYDPPTGILEVINKSNMTFYIALECSENLSIETPLIPTTTFSGSDALHQDSTQKTITVYPSYRALPKQRCWQRVWGSPKNPKIPCDVDTLHVFYFLEKVINEVSWKEICNKKLYIRKEKYTQKQLDSLKWRIEFQ
jgi:hypothetical protein